MRMSMSTSRVAFCLLTVVGTLFFSEAASAQDSHPKFELFAEGGISMSNSFTQFQTTFFSFNPPLFITSTTKTSLRTTGRLFTGIRFWVGKDQALEASYSFSPSSFLETASCYPVPPCAAPVKAAIPLRANFFAGNYVHTLPPLPKFKSFQPFLTAGVGGLTFFEEYPAYAPHDPFAVNLGGGFDHAIARHWVLRTEFRDWLFEMPHPGSTASGLVHNLVPSLGPVLRF